MFSELPGERVSGEVSVVEGAGELESTGEVRGRIRGRTQYVFCGLLSPMRVNFLLICMFISELTH